MGQAATVLHGVGREHLANLGRWRRGPGDPTIRHQGQHWWFTVRTTGGPALVHCQQRDQDVLVQTHGPGAEIALGQVPRRLGCHDQPPRWSATQSPAHARLLDGRATLDPSAHLPLGASDQVIPVLVGAILEQKVTGNEAFASWRQLLHRFGEPGDFGQPGAEGMRVVPDLAGWRAIPAWAWTWAGVDSHRSRTIRLVLDRAPTLERHGAKGAESLGPALLSLPGVGPWTVARVRQEALGDADAWTVDDYHIPTAVILFFTGRRATPHRSPEHFAAVRQEAEALLAPFAPDRFRAELLVMARGRPERHGPRRTLPQHLPTNPRRRRPG